MTIDWNKPLMYGDDPAKLISRDYRPWQQLGTTYYVVQVDGSQGSYLKFCLPDGRLNTGLNGVRNKTKKITKWYNLYAEQPGLMYTDSAEAARSSTLFGKPPIATLSVEIEVPCD